MMAWMFACGGFIVAFVLAWIIGERLDYTPLMHLGASLVAAILIGAPSGVGVGVALKVLK